MPSKDYDIGGLIVTVSKRRSSRNIRLTVPASGNPRVSIPSWTPYKVGYEYAKSKADWIRKHTKPRNLVVPNQLIGKAHRITYIPTTSDKYASRIEGNTIAIRHPSAVSWQAENVQKLAEKAVVRALRSQAESLLPQRLSHLAVKHGFEYKSVQIKNLKSRWGSCDSNQNIVLNLYLVQLPWHYIDYVIIHELVHTEIMRHGPVFWQEVAKYVSDLPSVRKQMRGFRPLIHSVPHKDMA